MRQLIHRRTAGLRALLCAAAAALTLTASADELYWSFATADPDAAAANLTGGTLTAGNTGGAATLISSTSPSASGTPAVPAYAGASGTGNAQVVCKTGALDAAVSSYFEFTLTPTPGYSLSLTEFKVGMRRTTSGPLSYSLRHGGDAYASDIATGSSPADGTWGLVSHTGLTFTSAVAVTFRLYGYGSTAASVSAANWRIDDLRLTLTAAVNGAPMPTITDVSPLSGTPGTAVTITGTDFGPSPVVRFNTTVAPGSTVNPEGTSISVSVPVGATDGKVKVDAPGGQALSPADFTVLPLPQLTVAVAPASFAETAANPAASGLITLPAALDSDLTVALGSSSTADATVPASVVIPANTTTATFDVTAIHNTASSADVSATITASAAGYQNGTTTVTVVNVDAASAGVVINKYKNVGNPGDIVELLVVGDGTPNSTADLRFMVIKDFSGSMANDGGGKFRFKDVPLFNGLRAGTLLVLTDSGSTASTDTDPSDFVLRLGLTDTAYFTTISGDFDISTTEMVMIKAANASEAGVTDSLHVLAAGAAGTQFTNVTTRKLRSSATTATGNAVIVNNTTSTLDDFNDSGDTGTKATGAQSSVVFGQGNNASNSAFISYLRGVVSVDGFGSATLTNATVGSIYNNRRVFSRSATDQTVALEILGSGPAGTLLTSVRITVPAAFGTPTTEGTFVTGAGLGSGTFTVTGQDIDITGATLTPSAGISMTIGGLITPDTAGVANDGSYAFNIQTAGDGGTLKAIGQQPAAIVTIPVANVRDVDANGLPADLNKTVAVEVVCTEEDLNAGLRTSGFGQDGDYGINIFIQGVELNLTAGTRYGIIGTIIQFNGLTEINPASATDIISLGAGTLPAPLVVSVPDLLATPEAYEGRLIKVNGLLYTSGTWGSAQTVVARDSASNAIDIRIQDGSTAQTPPSFPINLTGIFGQNDTTSPYTSGYQIMPRADTDVEALGAGAYYDWAALYSVGGPQEDSDGDGVPNMVEYATGTAPNDPLARNPPVYDHATGTFTVNKGAPGASDASLQYIVESSTDLTTWNTTDLAPAEDTATRLSVIYTGTAPRVYFHLKLVRP